MKIYTKTGDEGETGLFGGKRVSKASVRIDAYGTVDEVNSFLGMAFSFSASSKVKDIISWLQNILFVAGAELAAPDSDSEKSQIPHISIGDIAKAEEFIDALSEELSELTNFILPGGTNAAAALHVARAVCRRAERLIVALQKGEDISKNLLIFINRLSDLLFVLARYENHTAHVNDINWKSPRG